MSRQRVVHGFSKVVHLQEGDFVEVTEVDVNTKQSLTVGKKYQILKFSEGNYSFTIIADSGKKKKYSSGYGRFKPVKLDYAQ